MGKTVLVIGINGALGEAVARELLTAGHRVRGSVSRAEKVGAFRERMPDVESPFVLDLSDAERVKDVLATEVQRTNQLDGVIVCSAVAPLMPLDTMSLALTRQVLEINTLAGLAIYQATIGALRLSAGRLILTSSVSGRLAGPMQGAYCASKFALEALADTMRLENVANGAKIILLEPGPFRTPTVAASLAEVDALISAATPEESALHGSLFGLMKERISEALHDDELMLPAEVAAAALEALDSSVPEDRYVVGAFARSLLCNDVSAAGAP